MGKYQRHVSYFKSLVSTDQVLEFQILFESILDLVSLFEAEHVILDFILLDLIPFSVLLTKCGPKRFLLTKCGPYYLSVVPAYFTGIIIKTSSAMFTYP